MLPLPDNIFIVTNYKEAWEARCKCGHINNFMYSDAQHETTKREVDKYFGIKDKVRGYWEK
jgi:acetone carboxylase gamma subunit